MRYSDGEEINTTVKKMADRKVSGVKTRMKSGRRSCNNIIVETLFIILLSNTKARTAPPQKKTVVALLGEAQRAQKVNAARLIAEAILLTGNALRYQCQ